MILHLAVTKETVSIPFLSFKTHPTSNGFLHELQYISGGFHTSLHCSSLGCLMLLVFVVCIHILNDLFMYLYVRVHMMYKLEQCVLILSLVHLHGKV